MQEILVLAAAGACGTVCRYGLGRWIVSVAGISFPYGTLVVNVLGCLLLGVAAPLFLQVEGLTAGWRMPVTVGFFGAFTTFSTFGYETVQLAQRGDWIAAAVNVAVSVVFCLAATAAGITLGRALSASLAV